ncbi:hypothetical protein SAMN06295909_2637 [Plantibacter sp. VKM Ac-1784]|uniref:ATP-binding protein n=1 Tax=Plantibacter elymi (nom. nud.) TaxID=199708 RepID=A0ABY1REB5_9MICO|nr:hypothetical protein [Plantibacter sp. VKM Ac-1784]SMQ72340.1 hypothetical protein SAMN06295909_2637 [Plantibacter sp. VKM Ac-1784]
MAPQRDPASVLDLAHAPLGELAATRLVEAAAQHGDLAERHYLELKGPSDLSSKVSLQKVAKFILGAANRMPDRAAEAFEGYGVMIVGVTVNGAEGVPPVEMLTLAKIIQPILGADGPRWDIVRVAAVEPSRQVVLILVDPPRIGQPPFVCRSSGEGLQDGRVYCRADGETREPTSAEWDQLMRRGAAAAASPVEMDVSVLGNVTWIGVDDERTVDEFIDVTRRKLIDALPMSPKESEPLLPSSVAEVVNASVGLSRLVDQMQSSLLSTVEPEARSEKDYREQIDSWASAFRDAWPEAVVQFARHSLPSNEVSVQNETHTFLHDVELTIHLAGAVTTLEPAYEAGNEPGWADIGLPHPPRVWGPVRRDLHSQFSAITYPMPTLPFMSSPAAPPSLTSWSDGGSVDVGVTIGDLRPEARFASADGESILVVHQRTAGPILGTWRATVRGYNEVFTGSLHVDVADDSDLTDRMRDFLGLR